MAKNGWHASNKCHRVLYPILMARGSAASSTPAKSQFNIFGLLLERSATVHMHAKYPSGISPEKLERIRVFIESADKCTRARKTLLHDVFCALPFGLKPQRRTALLKILAEQAARLRFLPHIASFWNSTRLRGDYEPALRPSST